MRHKIPVSVLIITKQEERNIRCCLESVKWADEIIIVDSQSTDGTVAIAREYTDKIYLYRQDFVCRKRCWALENVSFSNDWVLMIDADEQATEAFREELRTIVSSDLKFAGYQVRYKYLFLGKEIRFGDPVVKTVLFRRSHTYVETLNVPESVTARLIETAHEQPVIDGKVGHMKSVLIHADKRPLHYYFARHNDYSTLEALMLLRNVSKEDVYDEILKKKGVTYQKTRRMAKHIFLYLPLKPLIYFVYSYILRLGFMDGYVGLVYNLCKAMYAFQIEVKRYEFECRRGMGTHWF
jgi:glycosyltransferase involved in cell wall biosynthesis